MTKSSSIAVATTVILSCFAVSEGFGQQGSTIESLGHVTASYRRSSGRRVSDDGSVIVGWSNGPIGKPHGFRWTAEGGMQELAPHPLDDESDAFGVSGDGSVVVGLTYGASRNATPARWKPDGRLEEPYAPATFDRGVAYGVSGDGGVAVGYGGTINRLPSHAYRYSDSAEPYDLGTIEGANGISVATDASYDAGVIVGWSDSTQQYRRAFRWTAATGVEQLELNGLGPWSASNAVSDDGSTIVGNFDPNTGYEYAFVWTADVGVQVLPKIVVGFSGKSSANDVSRDGSLIVGRCDTFGQTFSSRGAACVWKNGECRSLWDLLEHEYPTDLEGWSRLDSVEGVSADGKTMTGHGLYRGDQTAFRLTLRNAPPSVAPIAPLTVECKGETNVAVLSTHIGDDGDRVTVRWKANGKVLQQENDVEPGSTQFRHDFPHGSTRVEVEASDRDATTTWSTTVTVSDTTAPTLSVVHDVVVPTDPRKGYATNVTLTAPHVFDVCDGEPTLANDAPERYPIGETIVRWTATDADGNSSMMNQRVVVEDREPPRFDVVPNAKALCDWGKVFATLRLTPPTAVDNASGPIVVTSDNGPRFRIGDTKVKWIATDEAGNSTTKSMIVTVVNRAPRARAGKTVRIEAKSERGAVARLDGSGSSDPDGHVLRYAWRASRVRFRNPSMSKPLAIFPVGTTVAKLTVTDEAGARKSARVRVIVKLANSEERPRGAQANRAFDLAAASAQRGAESGPASEARLTGVVHSAAAQRVGLLSGERVLWEGSESPRDAATHYATLRADQARHGALAAKAWLDAYAEAGDDAALASAIDALSGASYAVADLAER
ncbi:MAG TPA: HYR domain-containing protein [Pirellulaceae bacterium]|jgi:probable HAF family extracellular repeat protein|nr:HYR domain-containing protein [Pirellulaceae bacterium]